MWKAYEEAKVVVVVVDGGVRLFDHLPVFEFQLAFSVCRVLNIPAVGHPGFFSSFDRSSDFYGGGGA
jgi:hypothetical protein